MTAAGVARMQAQQAIEQVKLAIAPLNKVAQPF